VGRWRGADVGVGGWRMRAALMYSLILRALFDSVMFIYDAIVPGVPTFYCYIRYCCSVHSFCCC